VHVLKGEEVHRADACERGRFRGSEQPLGNEYDDRFRLFRAVSEEARGDIVENVGVFVVDLTADQNVNSVQLVAVGTGDDVRPEFLRTHLE
jgi:hypothetical protein